MLMSRIIPWRRSDESCSEPVHGGPGAASNLELTSCTVEKNKVGVQAQGEGIARVSGGLVQGNTEQDVVGNVEMASGFGGATTGIGIAGALLTVGVAVFAWKRMQAR
jgi:hypothetical protein